MNTDPVGAFKVIVPFSLHSPNTIPVAPYVGVTVTVVEIGAFVVFVAVNEAMFPDPLAAKPTAVFELVQAYVVPVVADVKFVAAKDAPTHTVCDVG